MKKSRYIGFDIPFESLHIHLFDRHEKPHPGNIYILAIQSLLEILEHCITIIVKQNREEYKNAIILLLLNIYKSIDSILILLGNNCKETHELLRSFCESYLYLLYIMIEDTEIRAMCFLYHCMISIRKWAQQSNRIKLKIYDDCLNKKEYKEIRKMVGDETPHDWYKYIHKGNNLSKIAYEVFGYRDKNGIINKQGGTRLYHFTVSKMQLSSHSLDIENHLTAISTNKYKFEPKSCFYETDESLDQYKMLLLLISNPFLNIFIRAQTLMRKKDKNSIKNKVQEWLKSNNLCIEETELVKDKDFNVLLNHFM